MKNSIYLTGFMGSGKSTCGKLLAKRLGMTFIDTDDLIESDFSMTTFDIIEKFGIEYFRRIENQKLATISQKENVVVSLGGGTLIAPQNLKQVLKNGILIYLRWDSNLLLGNLKRIKRRPLLKDLDKNTFQILFEERAEGYSHAHIVVDCDYQTAESVVDQITKEICSEK